jgi:4'-phosphopantetheinyl transferase
MREAIAGGAVGVWRVPVGESPPLALLSDDERERAERLRVEEARARFVACRVALRGILSNLTGAPMDAITFGAGEYGKPFLVAPQSTLHFNAAHSGGMGLVAVADGCEVGIDIETVDPERDMEPIAHRYFRPEEYAALSRLRDMERARTFTAVWTRKEAYLKARGTGIRGGLASFSVTVPPTPPRLVHGMDRGVWSMAEINCGSEYAATVCAAGRSLQVCVRDWDGPAAQG